MDIVWRERRDEVISEIRVLLAAENRGPAGDGDLLAQDIFTHRTTAARNVYQKLSADDKATIAKQVEDSGKDLNPPDIQQK